ncbi:MAG: glycosyl transferase [Acidobacteria bacterium]|nr:MAG: glycosyl transferase [Acidobacteriota bacterium]
MASTLFAAAGSGLLCVLGDSELPDYQNEDPIEIFRFSQSISNLLERTISFSQFVSTHLESQKENLRVCQFRDPWSGIPIISIKDRKFAAIYEVNGLPSIELSYVYPEIGLSTLAKIRALERTCWTEADAVITPSETMKQNLSALGVSPSKITVIPNGSDIPETLPPKPEDAPKKYILYFGALQRWQGIDVLLRAFALLADFQDLHLVIISSNHPRQSKPFLRLAAKLEIETRVHWRYQLHQNQLLAWIAHAWISVAPLTECSRNLQQGCCPLKVLESMALGVPVVASDLPSIRELMNDGIEGRLIRPGRPAELARAIRILLEYPDHIEKMGKCAQIRIQQHYTWKQSMAKLDQLYETILNRASPQPQSV